MIAVPYRVDQRAIGVGQGPLRILEALGQPCHLIELDDCAAAASWARAGFLNRRLGDAVAREGGRPLILAGSCNCALGVLAGLSRRLALPRLGLVWFDAHGDFNTPETSISGSLDGMALAAAVGDCHADLCAACGLLANVAGENVVLAAARDLDPGEAARLSSSRIERTDISGLGATVERLATRADAVYLHIDLDVLDPDFSPGVNCTTPGGVHPDELFEAIRAIPPALPIAATTIANYNPERDRGDRTLKLAVELAEAFL